MKQVSCGRVGMNPYDQMRFDEDQKGQKVYIMEVQIFSRHILLIATRYAFDISDISSAVHKCGKKALGKYTYTRLQYTFPFLSHSTFSSLL
jgi:hypothetical protein